MNNYGGRGHRPQAGYPRRGEPLDPKRKVSAAGFMFNPNFGASFVALKETGRMFIHLLALIFVQAGLIDARHPAVISQDRGGYGLFDIVRLAYERVEWRQENLAQISLFLAVCACLLVCALGVVYVAFGILFSVA